MFTIAAIVLLVGITVVTSVRVMLEHGGAGLPSETQGSTVYGPRHLHGALEVPEPD